MKPFYTENYQTVEDATSFNCNGIHSTWERVGTTEDGQTIFREIVMINSLSEREKQVLCLSHLPNSKTAQILGISEDSVNQYILKIKAKFPHILK